MPRIHPLSTFLLLSLIFAPLGCAHHQTPNSNTLADTTSLLGKPAPNVSLNMLGGKHFNLSAEKGSVLLLDYWATWCPPCNEALPHIQALSTDPNLAAKGLKVFAINNQESAADVSKFMQEKGYTFNVPLDPDGNYGNIFLIQDIPTTVIIGRDGVIRNVFEGYGPDTADQIKDAVNKALDEKSTS